MALHGNLTMGLGGVLPVYSEKSGYGTAVRDGLQNREQAAWERLLHTEKA